MFSWNCFAPKWCRIGRFRAVTGWWGLWSWVLWVDYGVIGEMAATVRLPYIDSHLTPTWMQPMQYAPQAEPLIFWVVRHWEESKHNLPGNGTRNPDIFFLFNIVGIFSGIESIVYRQWPWVSQFHWQDQAMIRLDKNSFAFLSVWRDL